MIRRSPDPRQALFKWVWFDPEDDRPDSPEDEPDDDGPPPTPPPLRARVSRRHELRTAVLWVGPSPSGVEIKRVFKRPRAARLGPRLWGFFPAISTKKRPTLSRSHEAPERSGDPRRPERRRAASEPGRRGSERSARASPGWRRVGCSRGPLRSRPFGTGYAALPPPDATRAAGVLDGY